MAHDPLDRHMQEARELLHALAQHTEGSPQDLAKLLPEVAENLGCALEELHVSEEELRQQNEELAASRVQIEAERRRYQELFDLAPDAYLVSDLAGIIQEANRAAGELVRRRREFLIGKPLVTFIAGPDRAAFRELLSALPGLGTVSDRNLRVAPTRAQRTTSIPARFTASTAVDEKGEVTGFRWIVHDITERVKQEQELERYREHLEELVAQRTADLRDSEERYRTVAEYTYDWEFWQRPDFSFAYVSPSVERVTGYPAQGFMLDPELHRLIVLPEDQPLMIEHERTVLETTDPGMYEYRIVRPDGEVRWIEHICQAVYDAGGNFAGRRGTNRDVTERQAAEAERERLLHELASEQALLHAIIDQAPVGILAAEAPSGRFVLVNQRIREIWREQAFRAHDVQEFNDKYPRFRPGGQPMAAQDLPLWRALHRGETVADEDQDFFRSDGTQGTLSANAAPVRDAQGKIEAAVVALEEVTYERWATDQVRQVQENLELLVDERTKELEQTADELARQNAFNEAVLNTAGSLVLVLDSEARIVRFNRACEELTGYSYEQVRDREFWFLLVPEEAELVAARWKQLVNNLANRGENHWVTRRGVRRLISFNNTVLTDPRGQVEYVISSGLDITEQRRLEEAIRGSEERYRSLVSDANVVVLSLDQQGVITYMNPYGLRFFGYSEEQVVGRSVLETILPPTDSTGEDLTGLVEEAVASPEDYAYNENENVTGDGRRVWMGWFNQTLRNERGEKVGLLAIGVDRTAQRNAEEMLTSYRESLRSLASELALAEERERRRIAVGIHDHVSQTLALCKLRLGSLRRSSLGGGTEGALEEVESLVDQVIVATRTLTFELSPPILYELGLGPALEWVCEGTTKRHGLPCYFTGTDQRLPLAEEVRLVLFQGGRELINNASKHSQASRVQVTVERDEKRVYVKVEDDGVGFDTSRLGEAVAERQSFGLFNIRERLHYLGGETEIDSAPGKGTRVTLSAPLAQE